jgi:hypothetical protein
MTKEAHATEDLTPLVDRVLDAARAGLSSLTAR